MEYQDTVAADGLAQGLAIRRLPLNAGDALIWHPQTPHGGSRIEDRSRTRFSIVMHVIPADVPVYHPDVFFNPRADFETRLYYPYQQTGGRAIVDQRPGGVGFGHEHSYPLSAFAPIGQDALPGATS